MPLVTGRYVPGMSVYLIIPDCSPSPAVVTGQRDSGLCRPHAVWADLRLMTGVRQGLEFWITLHDWG